VQLRLVDGCPALVRRPIRAAGDGLHPQAARSQRGKPFAVLGDSPPPAGFGWPLFPPRLARRDRAAASSALGSATWCVVGVHGAYVLAIGANEVTLAVWLWLGRQTREPMGSEPSQVAALSISAAAQQCQYRESSRARRMGWRRGVRPPSPSHGRAQSGRIRVGANRQRALSHPCMCRRVRVVQTVDRSVSDCHAVEYLC